MTKRIIIRPKASHDLDDHFAYIAEKNLEVALQFFDAARSTIAQLARNRQSLSRRKSLLTTVTEMGSEGFQEIPAFLF